MTKQTKTTLYIGANDKDTKTQILTMDEQRDIITAIAFEYTDGATVYTGNGIYKHDNGVKITEQTTIAIFYDVPQYTIKQIVDKIKTRVNFLFL